MELSGSYASVPSALALGGLTITPCGPSFSCNSTAASLIDVIVSVINCFRSTLSVLSIAVVPIEHALPSPGSRRAPGGKLLKEMARADAATAGAAGGHAKAGTPNDVTR